MPICWLTRVIHGKHGRCDQGRREPAVKRGQWTASGGCLTVDLLCSLLQIREPGGKVLVRGTSRGSLNKYCDGHCDTCECDVG